eukprot:superscaffoldBa00001395_g10358
MQRELESCLSLEYTSDSLPPLLHQFYVDRSYYLAQVKYLLMLRWRRFCHHTSVIEKLYPHYKDQMSRLTSEYEDAVQRARRLSASREKILTGRGNPDGLLTQDDVVIFLRWLICHLHSVKNIHQFLRVLHYIPACERKSKESQPTITEGLKETLHQTQLADGVSVPADDVPLHTGQMEEFLPELQSLINYFHLSYDAGKIKTTADEMELFSVVWREFRTIFRQQEQMKTFPQYDGTDVKESQWGRKSASMALKKEASWIPFIQVKPKRDPCQQKLVTKLKEKKSVDELLKMQSSYSLEDSLQLLGLNDGPEEGTSDPIITRGAYLSLIYLRHLKLRQLQRSCLGMLNYLRSVERTLTFDLAGLQLEEGELCSTAEETGRMNAARGGRGEAGGLGSKQYSHNTPVDYKVQTTQDLGFDEFHLYMRPEQFEVAEQKDRTEQRPVFITAVLEDDSSVDRFTPSHLPLSIQELDENQIGRFSFSSEEAVVHLMNKQGIENLQVTLACQGEDSLHSDEHITTRFESKPGSDTDNLQDKSSLSKSSTRTPTSSKERLMEAFVSIQLEKVGLRDEMLNSFMKTKQAMGGAELLEIQRQVDRLSDPSSPESVSRLLQLRRQVVFLQFDAAVRHLIREAFISSGDIASYQTVSDNMAAALPLLSDSIQTDVFSLTLPVPRPLETKGCQAQTMYPWRSFITCHGLLPLHVWDVPPIEHCMQLCLSGLSDRSRLQANAAILGVSLLMEDVLNSGREAEPGTKSCLQAEEEEKRTSVSDFADSSAPPQDPIRVQSVLRGFLLLMKQLQVFKESWARRRRGVEMFSTAGLYQQFVKIYRAEIFYPSMRALAQQLGKEHDYEVLISGSQSLLPPPGASEVDVKVWQLHRLLESTECDMIRAVQRRISRDLTLVVSERTRQDTGLPTELWKKSAVKYSLSPERPQIVESFIQQLMEGAEEAEGQLRVSVDHLQQCLTHLGCSVAERERGSFLLYSQFYEQILQQQTQLLYQREQDLKNRKDSQASNPHKEAGLDEYQRQMEQDVSVMVNSIRREGVDRIIKLRKKKHGSTKDNDDLTLTQLKKEEVQELNLENSRLTALLCKLKALSCWRQAVDEGKLHRQLLQTQQREISSRIEALRVKMTSEEEVVYLQDELDAARHVLTRCQTECSSAKKLLSRKTEELQVVRHRSAQEARSRRELDSYRVQSLEQMRADVEDRERRLRALSGQLDRGSKMSQLQRQRSAKEIQKVKGKLQQERCLKQEAFQQVDKLQSQVSDMEAAFSRCTSTAGLQRAGQQQSALQLGSLTNHAKIQDFAAEPRHRKAETAGSRSNTRMDRPKADPSRLRVLTAETTLPDL